MFRKLFISISMLFFLAVLFSSCPVDEELPTYTVVYHSNFGGNPEDDETFNVVFKYGAVERLSNPGSFVHPDGYWFIGWSLEKDGEIDYKAGESTSESLTDKESITVYARWGYRVMFDPDGGSPTPGVEYLLPGKYVKEPAAMTKLNYTLNGWFKKGTESRWNFASQSINESDINTVPKTLTLAAKWDIADDAKCYVSFFTYLGDLSPSIPTQTIVKGGYATQPPNNPERTGYTFAHWSRNGVTSAFLFAFEPVTETMTLNAQWIPVPVSSINLIETSITLDLGSNKTLNATAGPPEALNKTLSWSSGNELIATVNNSGLVTAVGAGFTTITVTAADGSGIFETCSVTVKPIVNIYSTGWYQFGGSSYAGCWINGTRYDLETSTRSSGNVIAVSGNSAYIAGWYEDGSNGEFPCYWKVDINTKAITRTTLFLPPNAGKTWNYATAITMAGTTAYIGGTYLDSIDDQIRGCYWRTDTNEMFNVPFPMSGASDIYGVSVQAIVVDSGKVHIAGTFNIDRAFYWGMGDWYSTIILNSPDVLEGGVIAMAVSGGNAHIVGICEYTYGDIGSLYWENIYLRNNLQNMEVSRPTAFFVKGTDIYIGGFTYTGSRYYPCYWLNKTQTIWTSSTYTTYYNRATDICVWNEFIYMACSYGSNPTICYLENENLITLGNAPSSFIVDQCIVLAEK